MSFFGWTAPLFKLSRHRFTDADFRRLADHVRPCVPPGGRLLDLGGGTGDLGLGVGKVLGADVVVADVTPEMLYRVSAHPSMSVRLTAAEALPAGCTAAPVPRRAGSHAPKTGVSPA